MVKWFIAFNFIEICSGSEYFGDTWYVIFIKQTNQHLKLNLHAIFLILWLLLGGILLWSIFMCGQSKIMIMNKLWWMGNSNGNGNGTGTGYHSHWTQIVQLETRRRGEKKIWICDKFCNQKSLNTTVFHFWMHHPIFGVTTCTAHDCTSRLLQDF